MKKVGKVKSSLITSIVFGSFLIGCSEVRLLPKAEEIVSVKSTGEFCVSDPEKNPGFTKFLFLVDKTGSNSQSDPGRRKRADNIQRFIQEKSNEPGYMWDIVGFSSRKTESYVMAGTGNTTYTDDPQEALGAVERMRGDGDGGSTPYLNAMGFASSQIATDIAENPEQENNYLVFFISDGQPTDTSSQSKLDAAVRAVTSQGPNVIVSTAFYGSNGSGAVNRLAGMAQAGGGEFVNFETSADWDFNDLIPPTRVEPWLMKKFLVYNVSSAFCLDGATGADSDADGMCDRDEIKFPGFDPQNRFSFGDNYGDYFHWFAQYQGAGEPLPVCNDANGRSDDDRDLLTLCEEKFIRNLSAPEGIPQNGDPNNPDTDRDGVIDGIETFVYITSSMAFAMDPTNLSRSQFDGEEDAEIQIDQHRNPLVRDANAVAYDTKLDRINNGSGRDCFRFSQSILPLEPTLSVSAENTLDWLAHGPSENKVLVYYIQTPKSDPNNKGVFKYSYQNLEYDPARAISLGTDAGLKVNDFVFQTFRP